ncbi:MAG: metallophosphoesterase [Candidatus Cloacimonetes bacterium]|nr:metallophosphoesterase [Candidatus Cloacimonadota bacterium]
MSQPNPAVKAYTKSEWKQIEQSIPLPYCSQNIAPYSPLKEDRIDKPSILNIYKPDFKLLQLTDLHLQWNGIKEHKEKTYRNTEMAIRKANPDFIMITGDMVWACLDDNMNALKEFSEFMDSFGIPWSAIPGNHDTQLTSADQFDSIFETSRNCLYCRGPEWVEGHGNHQIIVSNSDGTEKLQLICLDSHDKRKYFINGEDQIGYDYIYPSQIEWVRKTMIPNVPAYVFIHIPLPEFTCLSSLDNCTHLLGINGEKIGCPPVNTGLFYMLKEKGNTKLIACGHDHFNSMAGDCDGILLSYGLPLDFDVYTDDAYQQRRALRGARSYIASAQGIEIEDWILE